MHAAVCGEELMAKDLRDMAGGIFYPSFLYVSHAMPMGWRFELGWRELFFLNRLRPDSSDMTGSILKLEGQVSACEEATKQRVEEP